MKNLITLSFIIFTYFIHAQDFKGLDKSPMDMIEFPSSNKVINKLARVIYSRPQLKGRAISSLVPDGKVWRLGANESTELTLYSNMKLAETEITAGSYTLYAITSGNDITIIINKATHVWGAYSYDQNNDIARLTVPWEEDSSKTLEAFSMIFNETKSGFNIHLGWGKRRAVIPFAK